ncbi:16S rRNA pseudouridine(516) synthase [Gemella cuniculi]|uniref:16S rRNA pseudouridine(516) synthase n=1 Tax=Gemella cuniculi TaxID=150240 RepID=UPI00040C68DC|nr:16S rRNA pseudouridine(516) synthase [Gemella cuniculi]
MRLDKFVSSMTNLSRADAKKIIKKGIIVNGSLIKSSDYKVDENVDEVVVDNKKLVYQKYIYIMMNKPQGVISATVDDKDETVIDLLEEKDKVLKLFPVGRLDKNTEGLMFLTNDGELAHKLISPKKDIIKKYYVEVEGLLKKEYIDDAFNGIILEDGYKCKSAILEILSSSNEKSTAYINITEGRFHQVKRMMKTFGTKVIYLKRLTIGSLILDENLRLGEYRYLSDEEIKKLKNKI